MKRFFLILPILALLAMPVQAKKKIVADTLSYERQQQFTYYYYEALRCIDQAAFDKALAAYRMCLAIQPNDPACNNAVGRIYGALRKNPEHYFETAYLEAPALYWEDYANFLWNTKRPAEAREVLENVVKIDPTNTDAIRTLISCLGQFNAPRHALKALDKLRKQEGVTEYYTQTITQTYLQLEKPKKAIEALDYYLTNVDPEDFRFPLLKAQIYESIGDSVTGMKVYQEEVQRHPDNPYIYFVLLDRAWGHHDYAQFDSLFIGLMHSDMLDYEQKLKCMTDDMKRINCIDSLCNRILLLLIDQYPLEWSAYYNYAQLMIHSKNLEEAESYLLTAIDLCPQNQDLWSTLYSVYAEQDKEAEVEDLIERAYVQFPKSLIWHYHKIFKCLRHDLDDEAMQIAIEATQMVNPTKPELLNVIWTQLADMYLKKEMIPEALDAYEKAYKLDPEFTYMLNNYAWVLATNGGDLRKAELMSQKTIKAEPDNPVFLDTYAWILHLQGQDALAAFYMKKALKNMTPEQDNETYQDHYNEIIKAK